MDIVFLEEKILEILREYYADAVVDKIVIKKSKLVIYGRARDKWFKVIINKRSGEARVYSPSKTVEHVLKRRLSGHVQNG